jgi:hypothetical protein
VKGPVGFVFEEWVAGEGIRFVRLDLGAICAAQVLVQLAEEASFLSVYVD